MSSAKANFVLDVALCETELTICEFYGLIQIMQGKMPFSSTVECTTPALRRACGCC
jgi:hypothetical protein